MLYLHRLIVICFAIFLGSCTPSNITFSPDIFQPGQNVFIAWHTTPSYPTYERVGAQGLMDPSLGRVRKKGWVYAVQNFDFYDLVQTTYIDDAIFVTEQFGLTPTVEPAPLSPMMLAKSGAIDVEQGGVFNVNLSHLKSDGNFDYLLYLTIDHFGVTHPFHGNKPAGPPTLKLAMTLSIVSTKTNDILGREHLTISATFPDGFEKHGHEDLIYMTLSDTFSETITTLVSNLIR